MSNLFVERMNSFVPLSINTFAKAKNRICANAVLLLPTAKRLKFPAELKSIVLS